MSRVLLKPITTQVEYQGQYAWFALRLLANPILLYEGFLRGFGKYGLSLRDLKYEPGADLSESNINCFLLNFNVQVRVRSERLEVTIFRMNFPDRNMAAEIVSEAWNAIQASDPAVKPSQHSIMIRSHTDLPDDLSLDHLLKSYVSPLSELRSLTRSGVILYLAGDPEMGEKEGSVILDVSTIKKGALYLQVSAIFDAEKVPTSDLTSKMEIFLTRHLDALGLGLEGVERRA